jgi:hypothetical protein
LPDWSGSFYPEGMPPEWRLAYYNSQFSCVWLPHADWAGLQLAAAEEWLGDTGEAFRFLLERGEGDEACEAALLAALVPRLGLLCDAAHPDLRWFDAGVDLRELSTWLRQRIAGDGATYLLSRDGDIATLNEVGTLLGLLGVGSGGRVG